MKKKIIKIKENDILNIVKKIVTEQQDQTIIISTVGKIGDITNKFSGVPGILNDLKKKVEAKFGTGSYELVPFDGNRVVDLKYDNDAFQFDVKLRQSDESKSLRYFDMVVAVYSEVSSMRSLDQAVVNALSVKGSKYGDSQQLFLNTYTNNPNHLTYPLDNSEGYKNLDPQNPDKAFKLKIGVIVGKNVK